MPNHHGPITPEGQRRFEAARRALAQMCPGRERSHPRDRGAAVARLAGRGYAVVSGSRALFHPSGFVVPLDSRGVVYLGLMLPGWGRSWKSMEAIALATLLEAHPPRRW
jgi:hypothetical protein